MKSIILSIVAILLVCVAASLYVKAPEPNGAEVHVSSKPPFEQNLRFLSEIRQWLNERDCDIVVALMIERASVTNKSHLTDTAQAVHEDVVNGLTENDIPHIDLKPEFIELVNSPDNFTDSFGHLSAKGAGTLGASIEGKVGDACQGERCVFAGNCFSEAIYNSKPKIGSQDLGLVRSLCDPNRVFQMLKAFPEDYLSPNTTVVWVVSEAYLHSFKFPPLRLVKNGKSVSAKAVITEGITIAVKNALKKAPYPNAVGRFGIEIEMGSGEKRTVAAHAYVMRNRNFNAMAQLKAGDQVIVELVPIFDWLAEHAEDRGQHIVEFNSEFEIEEYWITNLDRDR